MHLARQTWRAAGAMGCGDGLCRRAAVPRRPRTRACVRRQCVRVEVVTVELARVEVARVEEVARGGGRRERARLLRVVQLGARSRHALGVALVGHFLRSAMRRAGRQAAEQQAVWPARRAAASACREGAAAPDRARNRAALWRRLRPHLHHVLDVLCRQLALHLHLGGVNLLLVHCAHTERGMQGEPAPLAAKQEALVPAVQRACCARDDRLPGEGREGVEGGGRRADEMG